MIDLHFLQEGVIVALVEAATHVPEAGSRVSVNESGGDVKTFKILAVDYEYLILGQTLNRQIALLSVAPETK